MANRARSLEASAESTASLLGAPAFRRLWLASAISRLGTQVGRIGLVLFLVEVSGRVGDLALLIVLETLPGVLVAPFAGSLVDRVDRRRVMIQADVVRAALLAVIIVWPHVLLIYVVASLHSIAGAFYQPAQRAAVPGLVEPEQLSRANGLVQSADHASYVLGPIVGAQLMLMWGLTPTLLVDAATFLASALLLLGLPRLTARHAESEPSDAAGTWAAIRDGFGYARRHPLLLQMTGLFFVSLAATGLWLPLAPFFLRDRLGAPEAALGWQLGAFGLGAILGGIVAAAVIARLGAGRTVSLCLVLEGVCMAIYSQLADLVVSTGLILIWGVVVSLIIVPFYSILQTVVDERFLGRIFALVQQSEAAALLVAMAAAALLARHVESHSIFAIAGVAYAALAAAATRTRGGRALLAVT
ncbi:MAG: MFS transporter [Acidobacteriota bacterium]